MAIIGVLELSRTLYRELHAGVHAHELKSSACLRAAISRCLESFQARLDLIDVCDCTMVVSDSVLLHVSQQWRSARQKPTERMSSTKAIVLPLQ
jgi:hypothetical protein